MQVKEIDDVFNEVKEKISKLKNQYLRDFESRLRELIENTLRSR